MESTEEGGRTRRAWTTRHKALAHWLDKKYYPISPRVAPALVKVRKAYLADRLNELILALPDLKITLDHVDDFNTLLKAYAKEAARADWDRSVDTAVL
jgi:hypothetical protein